MKLSGNMLIINLNEQGEAIVPVCTGCNKTPNQIDEYVDAGMEEFMTPNQYVREEEGTYNKTNGHFLCTSCYIDAGCPSSNTGWVAP